MKATYRMVSGLLLALFSVVGVACGATSGTGGRDQDVSVPAVAGGSKVADNLSLRKTESVLDAEAFRFARVDSFKVRVRSSRLLVIGRDESGKSVSREYVVATAMEGRLSAALPYGKVGEVTMAALNPPWTPTTGMIQRAIRSGKRPPRPSAPGAKGNPLGGFKLYFLIDGNRELGLHATTPEHEAEIRDETPNRQTNGCVRMRKPGMIGVERVVVRQNGHDMEALLSAIAKHPTKPIFLTLRDRPKVVYLDE